MKKIVTLFLVLSGFAATANAAYLDASSSNTTAVGGGSISSWTLRTDYGLNTAGELSSATPTVYQARDDGGTVVFPQLVTTISGLIPGFSYRVEVAYHSKSTLENWNVTVDFDPITNDEDDVVTSGTTYGAVAATIGDVSVIAGTQHTAVSGIYLYTGLVGTEVADENGEILVYIDDIGNPIANNRAWYDGLYYTVTSPAYDPNPDDEATGVAVESVELSWMAGRDPDDSESIHPDIVKHYLAYSIDEPNFISPIEVTTLSDDRIGYNVGDLSANSTYYWTVYTVIGSGNFGDPNCLEGDVWSFETVKTQPSFDLGTQPQDVLDEPGTVVTLTALANVESGTSEIIYQWYKGEVGSGVIITGETNNTMDISLAIDGSNDGYYYCTATNDNENYSTSDAALVQTKRQIADLSFDNTLADAAGGAGVTMTSAVYSTDVPYDESAASLSFDGAAAAGIDGSYMQTKDVTISVWFKYSATTAWQRIYDFGNGTDAYIFLSPSNGSQMRFAIKTIAVGSEQYLLGTMPSTGVWNHVVVTMTGDTGVMYLNGLPVAENTAMTSNPIEVDCAASYLGDSQWTADPYLTGLIDNLEIFNYGMTATEIADMYTSALNTYICIEEVEFDIAGPDGVGDTDCKVDMLDFAAFAAEWLECGLYPASACNE